MVENQTINPIDSICSILEFQKVIDILHNRFFSL